MTDWISALYRRFEDGRTRPAVERLARVPLQLAARVIGPGCGPGNPTDLLVRRFPQAEAIGLYRSVARRAFPRRFILAHKPSACT